MRNNKLPVAQLHHDMSRLLLGDFLGEGVNRRTFRCRLNDKLVVKVSENAYTWQNVNEWEVWWYADAKMQKWLAPCRLISPCGIYLVQDYVESVRREELPKTLPRFLVDQKVENYGMLDGHLVARDYGTMIGLVTRVKGRRRADWEPDHEYDGETL